MKKFRQFIVLLLLTAVLTCTTFPAYAGTVTLKTRMGCCVRIGPGTSYRTIAHMSKGKTVKGILGKGEGGAIWLKVTSRKFSGKTGYISAYCLKKTTANSYRIKITKTCFVRSAPDKNASAIGVVYNGQKFTASGYTAGWVKIGSGWVYSGCCKKI